MTLETQQILDRLYPGAGERLYPGRRRAPRKPRIRPGWLRRVRARLRRCAWYLAFGFVLTVVWAVAHLYYYNRLVDMEYDVQEAWAQVETQFQRRYHIQQNLTRMVLEYAHHERDLMVRLTRLRMSQQARTGPRAAGSTATDAAAATGNAAASGATAGNSAATDTTGNTAATGTAGNAAARAASAEQPAGAPPADEPGHGPSPSNLGALKSQLDRLSPSQLNDVFPHIQFLAEQYPKLRLSENFQQFSKATIETEDKIADEIKAYNKTVNIYTTVLMQFPGVIFGKTCGFKPYDFYLPERDKLTYRPVQLSGSPRGN